MDPLHVPMPQRLTPTGVGSTRLTRPWPGSAAAHPYGRGEHVANWAAHDTPTGSPPRAYRLTPTGVGSTPVGPPSCSKAAAHPHGRGEHPVANAVASSTSGSPPRAWGALDLACSAKSERRLTPHGRGEHCTSPSRTARTSGSPPRAWGARVDDERHPGLERLTPTPVGSTATAARSSASCTAHPHGRGEGSPWPAHPHGRGEHSTTCAGNGCASGSPPRAWGARHHHRPQGRRPRLTPTGVGSTSPARSWPARTAAHPHGRGEHDPAPPGTHRLGGSPPRAWGARSLGLALGSGQRLTPTGVGSTTPPPVRAPTGTAHPHGRGEHALVALRRCGGRGSPPRAWGAQLLGELLRGPGRLTPTGVGSTGPDARRTRRCTAHPHGRGEHVFTATATGSHTGSPPRAWGAHRVLLRAGLRLRLTPTGVGSTGTCTATRSAPPAHPHGRGEHSHAGPRPATARGSPPTGVGSTPPSRPTPGCAAAHPHGRGEHVIHGRVGHASPGSPPRAWGALPAGQGERAGVRLTPTGVGSTASMVGGRVGCTAHPHGRGEHAS